MGFFKKTMKFKELHFSLSPPKGYDKILHWFVIIAIVFGTVMIITTNIGKTSKDALIVPKVAIKQLLFFSLSYICMVFFAHNFTMKRFQKLFVYIAIILLILLIWTHGFEEINGSKAWIRFNIAGVQVTAQPSEFAKVYMICLVALIVEFLSKHRQNIKKIIVYPIAIFVLIAIAIASQKDFGTLMIFCSIVAICCLIPSDQMFRKLQNWIKVLLVAGTLGLAFCLSDIGISIISKMPVIDHVATRIENTLNPFLDPYKKGYQPINGLYGFARGGLFGSGFGGSIQKYGYLTQSDNDYILSIIVEEIGIWGLSAVVILYIVIIYRLFYYALRAKSEGQKVILVGTSLYIFIHFALNVGGVSGLIPLTGVPLLFVSNGSSSLISIMCAIGICQSIISHMVQQGVVVKSTKNKKIAPQIVEQS